MAIQPTPRYEIDHRLKFKDAQFAEALLLATDVRLEAIARDGLVVPGQNVQSRSADRQSQAAHPGDDLAAIGLRLRDHRPSCAKTTSCCARLKARRRARSRRASRPMRG